MKSVDAYLGEILADLSPLSNETRPLEQSRNAVLRSTVTSRTTLPPWPNSAMDGYAVLSSDLADASASHPVELQIIGDIPAGMTTPNELVTGSAFRIMTGAPVPRNCDAVVPIEQTVGWSPENLTAAAELPRTVQFDAAPTAGAHIRQKGEDISTGDVVAESGVRLTPARLAAIAAAGHAEVEVSRLLRATVIATGSELVPVGQHISYGQIYDSNSVLLSALLDEAGVHITSSIQVHDDANELRAAIGAAQQTSDVILLTGGASVGAHDTTRFVLDAEYRGGPRSQAGSAEDDELRRLTFSQVAMQPGKPQGFGTLADGTHVWALPGNPVSVWVSYFLLVEPALARLVGLAQDAPDWIPARAGQEWSSPSGREQFIPVRISTIHEDIIEVIPSATRGSGSHLAASLARAQGIVRVPASVTHINKNDIVLLRRTT